MRSQRARDRVQPADACAAARQRHVERFLAQTRFELVATGCVRVRARSASSSLSLALVDAAAHRRALVRRQLAERLRKLA